MSTRRLRLARRDDIPALRRVMDAAIDELQLGFRTIGRMISSAGESAARAAGFANMGLIATLAREPLYRACGYETADRWSEDLDCGPVPVVRMRKSR